MVTTLGNEPRRSDNRSFRRFDLFYLLLFGSAFFLFYIFNRFVKNVTLIDIFYILLTTLIFLYLWIEYGAGIFKKWYRSDNLGKTFLLGILFSVLTSTVMIVDNLLFVEEIVELKGMPFFVNLSVAILFGTFIEELIYRGVIIDFFGKRVGVVIAIPISAILFSLAHIPINFVDFVFIFVVGICFGILYAMIRNLIASTVAHSISNITVFIFIR